jgi:hypothetical protein
VKEMNDERYRAKGITRKWAAMAMLCLSPICFLFIYLGDLKIGLGAWACAAIVLAAVRERWDLRDRVWFWIVITVSIVLQIPFILFVPWNNKHWSYISLLPIGFLDYLIVSGSIKLVEKVMKKSEGEREV